MKRCPRCAEDVRTEATTCKHCHHEFTLADKRRHARDMGVRRVAILCAVAIIVCGIVLSQPKTAVSGQIPTARTQSLILSSFPYDYAEGANLVGQWYPVGAKPTFYCFRVRGPGVSGYLDSYRAAAVTFTDNTQSEIVALSAGNVDAMDDITINSCRTHGYDLTKPPA